ncbi:Gfo/Idh/MocA family oxidoreductase [Halobacillus salinarum]|uniref:Gfo/Idh/MocA family oxidoreductase n=1 Tax=Halobacillus salinarum TaxID=2932257 RepID=A0ABY4EHW8_9BACI|nr:Gfo/Idh/MocA family oxidoreductase [Halobacillus salinarum]UOQ44032.1 Gfo/Idh/MocA family oxidoreductase [Halobacillus salinarum]
MSGVKVGLVGCGNISSIYLENAVKFESFEISACADVDLARAKQVAAEYGITKAVSVEEVLHDPEIELVLNLTPPSVHAEIAIQALNSGKHVYNEKPLSVTRSDAKEILAVAEEQGLFVGNAPDTFLGGGLQTCRKIIDDGLIGDPVSATGFMMIPGHERWHPNPEFFYQPGAGPMFDMGPYYLTALIFLMGPIKRVTGSAKITFAERTITSEPKYGEKIKVATPTQVNGVLDFESGATASIITSFDTWHHQLPPIEIYGSKGSLVVPDPNHFSGPVFIRKAGDKQWSEHPLTHGFTVNSRGIGVAEFCHAVKNEKSPRANGNLAYHVLDVMQGIYDSSEEECHYKLTSYCNQPAPLPAAISEDNFDRLLTEEMLTK